jgi:DNA-binding GntR family transcriptional regulator
MTSDTSRFVRPPTLTATVANHIREAIARGERRPGSPLHEAELSAALKVSRGTVREALRLLHDESVVDILPHQGAFVMQLSARKAWEIYTLRAQLEPYAVRLALERRAYTADDLEDLDGLVRRMGDLGGDPFERIAADMEFHRVMCERGGHGALMEMLRSLQSQTRLFILNTMIYQSDPEQDETAHRAILDALREGDATRTEEVVRDHITETGTALVRRLEEQEAAAGEPPSAPADPLSGLGAGGPRRVASRAPSRREPDDRP